jgi:transketolase
MRTAFITQLIEEAKKNDKIFLVVGDLGYSVVEPFAELFPDRFLNAGIAEQNMTGVAAGLAMEGYNVFTYSIGNFSTLRCMEQIRYDVCYHNLSVKIVAVGAGYAYGPLGASHHTTEDIGMMRTIPGLSVCSPCDPIEAKQITSLLCNSNNPAYLRLGKAGEMTLHEPGMIIEPYKMICIKEGEETVILATGGILSIAKNAIQTTHDTWGLYSVPFIKPLDLKTLAVIAGRYKNIITLEEHQMSSGFGSAILEGLNDLRESNAIRTFPHVKRIAIKDIFLAFAGTQDYLRSEMGLDFSKKI